MPTESLRRRRILWTGQWHWPVAPLVQQRRARARRLLRSHQEFPAAALALYGYYHVPQRQQTRLRVILAHAARHCLTILSRGPKCAALLMVGSLLLGAAAEPTTETAGPAPIEEAQTQLALGLSYEQRVSQRPDFREAALWLHRAARQGLIAAFYYLGELYEEGFGVSRNRTLAFALYTIAARDGSGMRFQSRRALVLLEERLKPSDQRVADELTELLDAALPVHIDAERVAFGSGVLRILEASGFEPEGRDQL